MADRRLLGSLATNPDLDRWIAFTDDERVIVRTGKSELGQGILTALTAIAADELAVDPSRVEVRGAETGVAPNEWMTAGSGSIEQSGTAVRQACAHARAILLARAADELGAPARELTVDDGRISGPHRSTTYWTLASGRPFDYRVEEPARQVPASALRWTGRGLNRVDLPAKARGEACFVHDLVLEGMHHARVIRPPRPGARLTALPDPLEATIVRDGSFVAVVADREDAVVTAADRLSAAAVWEGGDVIDPAGAEPSHLTSHVVTTTAVIDGSAVDEPPGPPLDHDAPTVVRASYSKPFHLHGAIGPSAAVARFEGGHLKVWSHSQGVEILRLAIAEVVGLAPDDVSAIHTEGAGCYGHNGADDAALDAALVAMALPGRPVSLKWTRSDEHGWEPAAPAMTVSMAGGVAANGCITSWSHDVFTYAHGGRPRPTGGNVSGLLASWYLDKPFSVPERREGGGFHSGGHRNADPYYQVGHKRVVKHFVAPSPLRTSSTRSLGAFANTFAIESFMDELAVAAGTDPVSFRLAHLDDPRAQAVIEAAVEAAGGMEAPGGIDAPGRGLAFARYENVKAYVAIVAEVAVDPRSGEVRVQQGWIAADAGEIIDPDGLANQLEGGFVQATSWTLKEALGFDSSGVTTRDWESYPILRFSEAPEVTTTLLDQPGERSLGAGEASTGPTPAAIANAVYQATGVRLRDLPLRPDRVKAALTANLRQ